MRKFFCLSFVLSVVSVNCASFCAKPCSEKIEEKARSSMYMRSNYYPGALVAIAGNNLSIINNKESFNDENINIYMEQIKLMCETCRIKIEQTKDVQWKYALDEIQACSMVVEKVKELHDSIMNDGAIEPARLSKIIECLLAIACLQPRLKLFIVNILLDSSDPIYKRTYNAVMNPMYVYNEKYYDKDNSRWLMAVEE